MIWNCCNLISVIVMLSCSWGISGRENKALRREQGGQFHCNSEGFRADPNDCSIFYRCVNSNGADGDSENSLRSKYTAFKFQCGPATIFDTDTNVCVSPQDSSRTECLDSALFYNAPEPEPGPSIDDSSAYMPPSSSAKPSAAENPEFSEEIDNSISESSSSLPPRNPKSPACSAEGFFPIQADCTHFYRCVSSGGNGYVKYEFSCAAGTVWDPDNNACNHPWAVQRTDCRTTDDNNRPDNGEEQGGARPQQPSNQSRPENPDSQQPPGYLTPSGTSSTTTASSTSTVSTSTTSTPTAPTTSTASSTTSKNSTICTTDTPSTSTSANQGYPKSCSSEGFAPVEGDCKKFIRCVNAGNGHLIKYDFECGEDTVWDTELNTCNYPYAVSRPGCGTATTTDSTSQLAGQSSTSSQGTSSTGNSNTSSSSSSSGSTSSTSDSSSSTSNNITATQSTSNQSASTSSSSNTSSQTSSSSSSTTLYNNTNTSHQTTSSQHQSESSSTNQQTTSSTTNQQNTSNQQTTSSTADQQTTSNQQTASSTTNQQNTGTTNEQTNSSGNVSLSTTVTTGSYGSLSTIKPIEATDPSTSGSYTIPSSTIPNGEGQHSGVSTVNTTDDPNQNTSEQYATSTSLPTGDKPTDKSDTCVSEGFFPSTINCNKFYRCVNVGGDKYIKYEFNCGPGTVWDPINNVCNHPWAVPDCKTGSSSNSTSTTENTSTSTEYTTVQHSTGTDSLTGSTSLSTTVSSSESTLSSTNKPETTSQFAEDKNLTTTTTTISVLTTSATESTNTPLVSTVPSESQTTPAISSSSSAQSESTLSTETIPTEKQTNTPTTNVPTTTNLSTSVTTTIPTTDQQSTTDCQTTMKSKTQIECTKEGYFPYPGNCRKFYRCVDWDHKGQKFSVFYFDCPAGTIFDPSINICNHEDSVYPPRNCNDTSDSTTSLPSTVESTTLNETTSEISTITPTTSANQSTDPYPTTMPSSTSSFGDNTTTEHTTDELTTITQTTQFGSTGGTSSVTSSTDSGDQSTPLTVTDHSVSQTTVAEVTTLSITATTTTTDAITSSPAAITTLPTTTTNKETSTQLTTLTTDTEYTTPETTSGGTTIVDTPSYPPPVSTTVTTTIATTAISTSKPTTTASPSTKCPEDLGPDQVAIACPTGFKRYPKHCNLFYQCTVSETYEIKVLTLSCTNGTVYDQRKVQCLPPGEAEPCDGSMADTRSFRTLANGSLPPIPVKSQTQICPGIGSHPYPDNCKMFYKCKRNETGSIQGYIYQCPDGYTYWNVSKRCERMEKVPCNSGDNRRISRPTLAPVESRNIGFK